MFLCSQGRLPLRLSLRPAGRTQREAEHSAPRPGPEPFTRQEFDYVLLDREPDGQDAQPPDTHAPYGAFDLIETPPEDMGGPQRGLFCNQSPGQKFANHRKIISPITGKIVCQSSENYCKVNHDGVSYKQHE